MFNSKKLKIIACSLFLFLIIILPMGNVYAVDINPLTSLLLMSPATWPLQAALSISNLLGFDPMPDLIESPIKAISGGIISGVGGIMLLIGGTIMGLGEGILISVIESSSTWLSPTEVSLVTEGWGIVRNVANAVLVIGLVIIAINIILGREENKAKKTLINFIIVALLINFTPVLCGFIIDGANILTKSFITGGIDGSMSKMIMENFSKGVTASGTNALNVFIVSFVFLIFAFVSTFIYLLYALLFLGRSVILWFLVIFSPIAFATKVFPQAKYVKKIFPSILYWDDWVESFFQWCVIGIPAGMSIYLANMLIPAISFTIDVSDDKALMSSIVNSAIQCLTPFIILVAGFFISISSGGQVGSYVGGVATGAWAMTGGKTLGRLSEKAREGGEWMVEGTKRTAAGAAVGMLSGAQQGLTDAQGKGTLTELKGLMGGGMKGTVGGMGAKGREFGAKKIAEVKEGIGWTKRGEYASKLSGDVEESEKRMNNLSDDESQKASMAPGITRQGELDRAGAFNRDIKKGTISDAQLDYLAKNTDWAKTYGVKLKDAANARPDRAMELTSKSTFEIINSMSPEKAGKEINSPALLNPEVLRSIATSNTKILDGKINKARGKDIENIKNGFIKALKEAGVSTSGIDVNDLKGFVVTNKTEIQKAINTLKGGNIKDKEEAEGLKNLANYVGKGKLNKKS